MWHNNLIKIVALVSSLAATTLARPQFVHSTAPRTGSVWPPFPGAGQGYWSLLDQNDGELFVSRQLKQDTAQFELTEGLDLKEPKPVVKKDLTKKPASKTSVGGDNQKKSDNKKGGRRQF